MKPGASDVGPRDAGAGEGLGVLVYEEAGAASDALRAGLESAGFRVVAETGSPFELMALLETARPDVIVVSTDSPGRDVLEHLCVVTRDCPRPIVMFAADGDATTIREATRAGALAYVVGDVAPRRVQSVVAAAVARFEEVQRLRDELADTRQQLHERKVIERAKGLLMERRGLSEAAAYRALRTEAMRRSVTIATVARRLVEVAGLLA